MPRHLCGAGCDRRNFRAGTAAGLASEGGTLQGFTISEDNVVWPWGDVQIDGEAVVLSSPNAPNPIAARYALARHPKWANLFNGARPSAAAFATDVSPGDY